MMRVIYAILSLRLAVATEPSIIGGVGALPSISGGVGALPSIIGGVGALPKTEITINQETYTSSEKLVVTFNNAGTVSARDQLAIYPSSEVEGRYVESPPLLWIYTCGTQTCDSPTASGGIVLGYDTPLPEALVSWPLPAGTYRIVLLANGGGEILTKSPEITFLESTGERVWSETPIIESRRLDDAASAPVPRRRVFHTSNALDCGAAACAYYYHDRQAYKTNEDKAALNQPDRTDKLDSLKTITNYRDNYVVKVEAWVRAPVTGDYVFYTKSDDDSEVWVSSQPGTKNIITKVVELTGCCRRVTGTIKIRLEAGESHYLVGYMREGSQGDYFEIGFKGPGVDETVIGGGARLEAPTALDCGAPACAYYYHNKQAYKTDQDRLALGQPQRTDQLGSLKTRENYRDNYVVKVEAWVKAPSTGEYVFYTKSDDDSQVFVARNPRSKNNLVKVVELTTCCQLVTGTTTVFLQAGESYYVVGYMREGSQSDMFEIGFKGPGVYEQVIGGDRLEEPYRPELDCGAPACAYYYHNKQAYKTDQDRAALGRPQKTTQLTRLKTIENYGDSYVVKVEAWVKAPSTGDYVFYTRSDDDSQVFVARSPRSMNNLVKVVELTSCCRRVTGTTQVRLQAGEHYYLVGYMREGSQSDYFEIGFKGPGVDVQVIGGINLIQAPSSGLDGPVEASSESDFSTCGNTAAQNNLAGPKCAFPFMYGGAVYNKCITDDNQGEPWCYTKFQNPNGGYLKGNCVCESQLTSTGLDFVTSPRAGQECKTIGLQKITTAQACRHACVGLKSSFEMVNSNTNFGCTRKVTGDNLGACQWNTNPDAAIVDPNYRPVCTDAARGNAVAGVNRSNDKIVKAPEGTTCEVIKFADVTTEYDCHISCLLAGETQFQAGLWDRPAGCWVQQGVGCTWNSKQDSTNAAPNNFKQLCIRPKRHYASQCMKHGKLATPADPRQCCGLVGEITCPLGFVLDDPLKGAECDPSICDSGFCNAHPDAAAYRCVVPDWGWQPPTYGEASCGPTRIYHGKIGLEKCVEKCEVDPLCKSIFGALDKGDSSCWTCPEFTLRPATQLNDGEDADSNIATNYKAYQLKRHTKYDFVAVPNTKTCPAGTTALTETECRAVAAAIISNDAHLPVMDNTKAAGCRLPLYPANAAAARPTWSTGNGVVDKDTKIVCKSDVPIDALVSYNYTMFENAIVSGESSSTELSVRDGSKCVDGQITTYCSSSLTANMVKPYLEFQLKEPLMVMRLFIASRGDDHVNDLGRFTVWVDDGNAWQMCAFRQEVSFSQQYNEVYCDDSLYGQKIKIELGEGNQNSLQIADVVVQGIKPERWVITNPEYTSLTDRGACMVNAEGKDFVDPKLKKEICREEFIEKCAEMGKKACNGNPRCFGFAIDKDSFPTTITTYDRRALDDLKCREKYGLAKDPAFDFYIRTRKEITDVICIERPCWSYNYPTGEFKHAGCNPAELAHAEATRDQLEETKACHDKEGDERTACYNEQQFKRIVGRNKFATFNSKKSDTQNVCNGLRRREEDEESISFATDVRLHVRRLMSVQDTAAKQCQRRADITNNAACSNLKTAAEKTVQLYQDQAALAARRRQLLKEEQIVNGVTAGLDLVSGFIGARTADKPEGWPRLGKLHKPNQAAAYAEGTVNLLGGLFNSGDGLSNFDREVDLQRREAEVARIRDLSDQAAVCDAKSTDDLLCQITDLRERTDENFYNVLRVTDAQHRQVMEQLARQDTVLETSLITVFTIASAVEQTLEVLKTVESLRLKFPQTIEDLEFLRSRYQLFAGPDGDKTFDDFSKNNKDWCELMTKVSDRSLYSRLVRWLKSSEFLDSVKPRRNRHPDEKNVWTQCEVDEWARKYTDAHRSIEILYSFANGILDYTNEHRPSEVRTLRVRQERAEMAMAYQTHLDTIFGISVTAKRCVGDSFNCPAGYHATHVNPDPRASAESRAAPEKVVDLPCAPNTCDCPNGVAATGTTCAGHKDAQCQSCHSGFFLENGVCRLVEPTCEKGIPETDRVKLDRFDHGKTYCSSTCDEGYHAEMRKDPARGQGMDAEYYDCFIDECFCDSRRGRGLKGKECTTGHVGGGRELSDKGHTDSMCGSCHAGFELVAYTSTDGPRQACERADGFRFFSEKNFQGKRSRTDSNTEVWKEYEQTGSVVVWPGYCVGLRHSFDHWAERTARRVTLRQEAYMCNCHPDQVDTHHAMGFDHVDIPFQGVRRFRCSDPLLGFMRPFDFPGKIHWYGARNEAPVATGLVDIALGGDVSPPVSTRRSRRYHNPLPNENWFRGSNNLLFLTSI